MRFRPKLFFKEAILFATTMAVGIFTAYRNALMPEVIQLPEIRFSIWDAVLLTFLVSFFVFASRYKKVANFFFRFFLIFIVFAGAQIIAGTVISPPLDLFIALGAVLVFIFLRNILVHNLGVIVGIAGMASIIGPALSPRTAIFLLVVLSFYDILSVYVTKHMVTMARNMINSGAPFGFIVPSEGGSFFQNKHEATAGIGEHFMILGSGDVALPLVLACSLAGLYVNQAIVVALFSLGGLLLTHLIFVNQEVRKPMAALPPIATMAIIGYLVSLFI